MPEASPAVDGALNPVSREQGEAAIVERRCAQRRRGADELLAENSRDFDDRRLGPGRRLDDWRRKPEDSELLQASALVTPETSP